MIYDLLIIGGSAAGTAAAIYAARQNLDLKVISHDFGGEVATSGEIGNYPGFANTDGIQLTEKFREHLRRYKVEPETGIMVEQIMRTEENVFKVTGMRDNNNIEFTARAVIVATGVHPRELSVPGEKEFRNKGVSYCTTCDGPLYKNKTVAVIGGGNSANEAGIMLAGIAKKVYVFTINPAMTGDDVLIKNLQSKTNVSIVPNAMTRKIAGENFVTSLSYQDNKIHTEREIALDGIFIHVGMIPNSAMVGDTVKKDRFGQIMVNEVCETNIPGLFAAGDVTNHPYKQIAIAAGQGVTAALRAVDYLNRRGD